MDNRIYRIRILLSSPGNLSADRDVVRKVVENINLDSGVRERFHAELITWETHTRPSVGEYSQAVINEQFPKDIDIFVGMMGTYFGTPTPNWGSGTEEEFRIAFESHQANGSPDIMFYFSNAVSSLRDVDPEQLAKVAAFRKELGELGVYYWQYDDQAGLTLDLHRQLALSIIEITRGKEKGAEIGAAPDQSALLLPNYETLIAENAKVAFELLAESAVQHLGSHTSCMKGITKSAAVLTRKMEGATRKLNNAVKQGKVKLVENAHLELFEALKSYRQDLFRLIPKMRSEFEASMLNLQRALLIRRENGLEQEVPDEGVFDGARAMLESLLSLREIVISTNAVFESQFTSLPMFSIQSEIIAALHKDITVYVDSVERLVTKFCEDFE